MSGNSIFKLFVGIGIVAAAAWLMAQTYFHEMEYLTIIIQNKSGIPLQHILLTINNKTLPPISVGLNDTTRIKHKIQSVSHVTVRVFDSSGMEHKEKFEYYAESLVPEAEAIIIGPELHITCPRRPALN